jgi:hypothetical protein
LVFIETKNEVTAPRFFMLWDTVCAVLKQTLN